VQEAIDSFRDAKRGGPEGKMLKPGFDPRLNFYLGYLLHLKGYLSEPAALFLRVCGETASVPYLYMLARSYCIAQDRFQAEEVCKKLAAARRESRATFLQQLGIVNWQMYLPQWGHVCNKIDLHGILKRAGGEAAALCPEGCVVRVVVACVGPLSVAPLFSSAMLRECGIRKSPHHTALYVASRCSV
jgi:hypothetical protein